MSNGTQIQYRYLMFLLSISALFVKTHGSRGVRLCIGGIYSSHTLAIINNQAGALN